VTEPEEYGTIEHWTLETDRVCNSPPTSTLSLRLHSGKECEDIVISLCENCMAAALPQLARPKMREWRSDWPPAWTQKEAP
jgi:hypothetical protein